MLVLYSYEYISWDAEYFHLFVAVKPAQETRSAKTLPLYWDAQMSRRAVVAKYSQVEGHSSWRACWEGDGPELHEKRTKLSRISFILTIFKAVLCSDSMLSSLKNREGGGGVQQMETKPTLTTQCRGVQTDTDVHWQTNEWKENETKTEEGNGGRQRLWVISSEWRRSKKDDAVPCIVYFSIYSVLSSSCLCSLNFIDTWGNLLTRPNRMGRFTFGLLLAGIVHINLHCWLLLSAISIL